MVVRVVRVSLAIDTLRYIGVLFAVAVGTVKAVDMSKTETGKPATPLELKKHEVVEMKNWFSMFDKKGKGKLNKSELKSVFTSKCWEGSEKDFDEIFKKAAKKEEEFVNEEEYNAMLESYQIDSFLEKMEIEKDLRAKSDCPRKETVAKRHINQYLDEFGYPAENRNELMKNAERPDEPGKIDIKKFADLLVGD